MKTFHLKRIVLVFALLANSLISRSQPKPADYVNPFIGASTDIAKAGAFHGLGKTFPGAATPFGLVQVSPNTVTGGDNGSGYSYEHTTLEGFAFTQMSGVGWYGDLGNFLVMPTTGPLKTAAGREASPTVGYRSQYAKDAEIAKAGYYATLLTNYAIKAEATAAPHCGILRFTFPKHKQARIQIDLARRVGGTSTEQYIKVLNDSTIQGWMHCPPEGGGWGNGDGQPNYTVYFFAVFSKPLKNFGVWSADIPETQIRKREYIESNDFIKTVSEAKVIRQCREFRGKHLGFYTDFETQASEIVLMKAGISFVSIAGAKKNLLAEITDFNFDRVRENATALWNAALSKVSVTGATEDEKTVFYTALYHTMIDPRNFADVDGNYVGGDGKVHTNSTFTKRTIFSGWDVFRSQFPLQNIINPKVVNDMINSLIELADESGKNYLERWEFLNAYSGCMLGNPAIPVMVDAYNKGIRDFDIEKGFIYARNTCEKFGNGERGYSRSISSTLENAYAEWCLSVLADSLGKNDDADLYRKRSGSFKNIFDTEVKWFRPKDKEGNWLPWPEQGRLTQDYGCVESNPYQQAWFVPHDIDGLCKLLGGRQTTLADLENLFSNIPENMLWNNYYNHANEPVHHIPFMFNRLGAPWHTQYWTRRICSKAYKNSVEGLVGNEDVGQMSAWYVLAASGIHPICPGENRYEITSPVFDRIEFTLDADFASGKTFVIESINNAPANVYIQSASLNGVAINRCWITHEELAKGGKLVLQMSDKPNKNWGNN